MYRGYGSLLYVHTFRAYPPISTLVLLSRGKGISSLTNLITASHKWYKSSTSFPIGGHADRRNTYHCTRALFSLLLSLFYQKKHVLRRRKKKASSLVLHGPVQECVTSSQPPQDTQRTTPPPLNRLALTRAPRQVHAPALFARRQRCPPL